MELEQLGSHGENRTAPPCPRCFAGVVEASNVAQHRPRSAQLPAGLWCLLLSETRAANSRCLSAQHCMYHGSPVPLYGQWSNHPAPLQAVASQLVIQKGPGFQPQVNLWYWIIVSSWQPSLSPWFPCPSLKKTLLDWGVSDATFYHVVRFQDKPYVKELQW